MAIPKGITRDDVLAALTSLDGGVSHPFGQSTRYDVVYEGKHYPPKAVIGLASQHRTGRVLRPKDFSGGESRCNRILRDLSFTIESKAAESKERARRVDPRAAKRVLDAVFQGVNAEDRNQWEAYLADVIEYAAAKYPDRWVVALHRDYLRFIVGMVLCVQFHPEYGVTVLLNRKLAPRGFERLGHEYKYAPGCEEALIPFAPALSAINRIRKANSAAIDICAAAHAGTGSHRRAHSPGVLRYLEEVLERDLPNPGYAAATDGQADTGPQTTPHYWWVNHYRTHRQEIAGEYIWSPKTSKIKIDKVSYTNLIKVLPGDVVFSYAGGAIQAVGIAKGRAREAPKPTELKAAGKSSLGNNPGWAVPVKFVELVAPLRVKAHAKEIAAVSPEKHSPIGANGDVTGGIYLAAVPIQMAAVLRRLLGGQLEGALSRLEGAVGLDLADEMAEERIHQRTDIGPTQKARLINARRGQGVYRDNLEQIEKCCRVTGVSDGRYLRASHIKPWCESTDLEKLDGYNGLLLAPHVDLLFDRGWMSFSDDGQLLVAAGLDAAVLEAWALPIDLNVGKFRPEQCKYLAWHRKVYGFGDQDRRT